MKRPVLAAAVGFGVLFVGGGVALAVDTIRHGGPPPTHLPSASASPFPEPATGSGNAPTARQETGPAATRAPTPRTPVHTPTRRATTRTSPPGTPSSTEPVTGAGYDDCDELRVDYPTGVPRSHPAYRAKFDPDNDGWACEIDLTQGAGEVVGSAGAVLQGATAAPTVTPSTPDVPDAG